MVRQIVGALVVAIAFTLLLGGVLAAEILGYIPPRSASRIALPALLITYCLLIGLGIWVVLEPDNDKRK